MPDQPLATTENELNPFLGQRAHYAPAVDKARLGDVGLWTFDFDLQPWSAVRPTLERLEKEGVGTVWIPELMLLFAVKTRGATVGSRRQAGRRGANRVRVRR
jgi:hypothetical protein